MTDLQKDELIVPIEKLRELAHVWNNPPYALSEDATRLEQEIKQIAMEAVVSRGIENTPYEIDASPYVVFGFVANYLLNQTEFNDWQHKKVAAELRDLGRAEFERLVEERKQTSPNSDGLGGQMGGVS